MLNGKRLRVCAGALALQPSELSLNYLNDSGSSITPMPTIFEVWKSFKLLVWNGLSRENIFYCERKALTSFLVRARRIRSAENAVYEDLSWSCKRNISLTENLYGKHADSHS